VEDCRFRKLLSDKVLCAQRALAQRERSRPRCLAARSILIIRAARIPMPAKGMNTLADRRGSARSAGEVTVSGSAGLFPLLCNLILRTSFSLRMIPFHSEPLSRLKP
jgi:hypothetical protein